MSQPTSANQSNFTLAPGGINDALKVSSYHEKLMLLCMQALKHQKFSITSKVQEALKFNDIIVEIENYGTRFIQIKHRTNIVDLQFSHFLDNIDTDFDLYRNFEDYFNINRNKKFSTIKDFIVCTNCIFKDSKNDKVTLSNQIIKSIKINFDKNVSRDIIFDSYNSVFQLSDISYQTLKIYFIAFEIENCLSNKPKKIDYVMLTAHKDFIFKNVFNEKTKKFRDDFFKNQNPEIVLLGDVLDLRYYNFNRPVKYLNEIYKNSSNDQNVLKQKELEMKNQLCSFIKSLKFFTGFDTPAVDVEIHKLMQDLNYKNFEKFQSVLEVKIMNFFNDLKSYKAFESEDFKLMETEVRNSLVTSQKIIERTLKIFKNFNFVFKSNFQDLKEFILVETERILFLKSETNDTFYQSWKIYQIVKDFESDSYLFLQTSCHPENFKEGVEMFLSENDFNLLIVECNKGDDLFLSYKNKLLDAVRKNSEKSRKLIVISDSDAYLQEQNVKHLKVGKVVVSDLSDSSIEKCLESETVLLQEEQFKLNKLIDSKNLNLLNELPLADLENMEHIGENVVTSSEFEKDLFINRILVHDIEISDEISKILNYQNDTLNDIYVWFDKDFESAITANPSKNIHLLLKVEEKQVKRKSKTFWQKSKGDVTELKNFCTKRSKFFIRTYPSDVVLIVDKPGMGKTTYLNFMALQLKDEFSDYFILNVTLNIHTEYFEKIEVINQETVFEFFATHILKLKWEFEIRLFKEAFYKSHKMCILLDGVDEISPDYDEKFMEIVRILMGLKNYEKLLISTRPELGSILEKLVSHQKLFFLEYSMEDQNTYLVKYWKKHSQVKDPNFNFLSFSTNILNLINESISEEQRSFTGIPLITKMIAHIFNSKLTSTKLDGNFLKENSLHNLSNLYKMFVEEKLVIYFKLKEGYDFSQPGAEDLASREREMIEKLHRKCAVKEFLSDEEKSLLPNEYSEELNEDDQQLLLKVGIVFENQKLLRFVHKTFGEYFLTLILIDNLSMRNVLELVLKYILQVPKFQMTRVFFNQILNENFNQQTLQFIGDVITQNYSHYRDAFKVAADEKNLKTFNLLFKSLIVHKVQNPQFGTTLQELLLDNHSFLYNYFLKNDDEELGILSILQENLGNEFLKQMNLRQYRPQNVMLFQMLLVASPHHKNLLWLLNWLKDINDLPYVKSILTKYKSIFINLVRQENQDEVVDILKTVLKKLDELSNHYADKSLENLIRNIVSFQRGDRSFVIQLMKRMIREPHNIIPIFESVYNIFGLETLKNALSLHQGSWYNSIWFIPSITYIEIVLDWFDTKMSTQSNKSTLENLYILVEAKMTFDDNISDADVNETASYFKFVKSSDNRIDFSSNTIFEYFAKIYFLNNFHKEDSVNLFIKLLSLDLFPDILKGIDEVFKDNVFVIDRIIFKKCLMDDLSQLSKLILKSTRYPNILVWVLDILLEDVNPNHQTILENILISHDEEQNTLLHLISANLNPQMRMIFLRNLVNIKNSLSQNIFESLLAARNDKGKTYLYYLDDVDLLNEHMTFLCRETSSSVAEKILFSLDNSNSETFLFDVIQKRDIVKVLTIIHKWYPITFRKLLLVKNNQNQNFLFKWNCKNHNSVASLKRLLDKIYFRFSDDISLFASLLKEPDESGTSVIDNYVLKCKEYNNSPKSPPIKADENKIFEFLSTRFDDEKLVQMGIIIPSILNN